MEKSYFVHESSYIDEPVSIGDGTKIWHFCHIMKDSRIGRDCTLGQNVNIDSGVCVGNKRQNPKQCLRLQEGHNRRQCLLRSLSGVHKRHQSEKCYP